MTIITFAAIINVVVLIEVNNSQVGGHGLSDSDTKVARKFVGGHICLINERSGH